MSRYNGSIRSEFQSSERPSILDASPKQSAFTTGARITARRSRPTRVARHVSGPENHQ
jgi:hypothetical protein